MASAKVLIVSFGFLDLLTPDANRTPCYLLVFAPLILLLIISSNFRGILFLNLIRTLTFFHFFTF